MDPMTNRTLSGASYEHQYADQDTPGQQAYDRRTVPNAYGNQQAGNPLNSRHIDAQQPVDNQPDASTEIQIVQTLLYKLSEKVADCWQRLGVKLNVKYAVLKLIGQDQSSSEQDKAHCMLEMWLEQSPKSPFIELKNAFKDMANAGSACQDPEMPFNEIFGDYCHTTQSTSRDALQQANSNPSADLLKDEEFMDNLKDFSSYIASYYRYLAAELGFEGDETTNILRSIWYPDLTDKAFQILKELLITTKQPEEFFTQLKKALLAMNKIEHVKQLNEIFASYITPESRMPQSATQTRVAAQSTLSRGALQQANSNQSGDLLNDEEFMRKLNRFSVYIGSYWSDVAAHLNFEGHEIKNILRSPCYPGPQDKAFQMLSKWLTTKRPEEPFKQLTNTLRELNKGEHVKKLNDIFDIPPESSMPQSATQTRVSVQSDDRRTNMRQTFSNHERPAIPVAVARHSNQEEKAHINHHQIPPEYSRKRTLDHKSQKTSETDTQSRDLTQMRLTYRQVACVSRFLTGVDENKQPDYFNLGLRLGLRKEELINIQRSLALYPEIKDQAMKMLSNLNQRSLEEANVAALFEGIKSLNKRELLDRFIQFMEEEGILKPNH